MDARIDQPWRRPPGVFRHPDLLEWVRKNRGNLIWACLNLIQGWIAEGKPKPREAMNLGMFESWSETVGGVLEFAGISGFLRNMDDLYDTVDDEDYALRLLVERWWEDHGSREVGVSELYDTVKEFDIPLNIGGGDNERGQKIALGKYLQRKRDRQIAGRKIVPSKVSHGSQLWKLEPTPPLTSGESRADSEGDVQ
jgi:putative DNA primase/helicase